MLCTVGHNGRGGREIREGSPPPKKKQKKHMVIMLIGDTKTERYISWFIS